MKKIKTEKAWRKRRQKRIENKRKRRNYFRSLQRFVTGRQEGSENEKNLGRRLHVRRLRGGGYASGEVLQNELFHAARSVAEFKVISRVKRG